MPFINEKFTIICKEIFYVLTGALLIFSIMEIAFSGIVSAYININYVLIFWIFFAILILVNNDKN